MRFSTRAMRPNLIKRLTKLHEVADYTLSFQVFPDYPGELKKLDDLGLNFACLVHSVGKFSIGEAHVCSPTPFYYYLVIYLVISLFVSLFVLLLFICYLFAIYLSSFVLIFSFLLGLPMEKFGPKSSPNWHVPR
jgi:hypothetical protein